MTQYSTRQIFYNKHYLGKTECMCFSNIIFLRSKSITKAYIFKEIRLYKFCNIKNSALKKKDPVIIPFTIFPQFS